MFYKGLERRLIREVNKTGLLEQAGNGSTIPLARD
jgi:hypothetical protein